MPGANYVSCRTPEYQARIDKFDGALAVLCALPRPRPLTQYEIAEWCDVSQMLVWRTEKRAKRKLVARLKAIGVTKNMFRRGYLFEPKPVSVASRAGSAPGSA